MLHHSVGWLVDICGLVEELCVNAVMWSLWCPLKDAIQGPTNPGSAEVCGSHPTNQKLIYRRWHTETVWFCSSSSFFRKAGLGRKRVCGKSSTECMASIQLVCHRHHALLVAPGPEGLLWANSDLTSVAMTNKNRGPGWLKGLVVKATEGNNGRAREREKEGERKSWVEKSRHTLSLRRAHALLADRSYLCFGRPLAPPSSLWE